MSWPKKYPGECKMPVKIGQIVEASHFQTIFDWMRWYINWFVPAHVYESSMQGSNQGSCYSSYKYTEGHRNFQKPDDRSGYQNNRASLFCQYCSSSGLDFYWWDGSTSHNTYYSSSTQDGTIPPVYQMGGGYAQFKILKQEYKAMAFYDLWDDPYIP